MPSALDMLVSGYTFMLPLILLVVQPWSELAAKLHVSLHLFFRWINQTCENRASVHLELKVIVSSQLFSETLRCSHQLVYQRASQQVVCLESGHTSHPLTSLISCTMLALSDQKLRTWEHLKQLSFSRILHFQLWHHSLGIQKEQLGQKS